MADAREIISFWIDDVGPKGWYSGGAELDADIRSRFEPAWNEAMAGDCGLCITTPDAALAYCILTDQFPRNMFRGHGKSFASDGRARAVAKKAISHNWDMRIPEPQRQFIYMPLEHSENLMDQDRAVRLFLTRMPENGAGLLPHAQAHRSIIRKFGRFPARNEALGRSSTDAELAWLEAGGYRSELQALDAA